MNNDIQFVYSIIARLKKAGIKSLIFGGWAEELMHNISPRPHKDVDLLCLCANFKKIDIFLKNQDDLFEIKEKRFSHKRAFICDGVMIELLLVERENNKTITRFWNEYEFEWPEMSYEYIDVPMVGSLPVVKSSLVDFYRKHYSKIDALRTLYLNALSNN